MFVADRKDPVLGLVDARARHAREIDVASGPDRSVAVRRRLGGIPCHFTAADTDFIPLTADGVQRAVPMTHVNDPKKFTYRTGR